MVVAAAVSERVCRKLSSKRDNVAVGGPPTREGDTAFGAKAQVHTNSGRFCPSPYPPHLLSSNPVATYQAATRCVKSTQIRKLAGSVTAARVRVGSQRAYRLKCWVRREGKGNQSS